MNSRLNKIVTKLQNKEVVSVRRDQIRKAIEENGFEYFINRGYDEVYNVEPVKLEAKIENIRKYWLEDGKMWAQFHEDTKMLEITISYGYAYMELWASLEDKKEEVKTIVTEEVTTITENNINVEVKLNQEKYGVELYFNCKPEVEVRTEMKAHGFRYNGKTNCWYAKQSKETLEYANKFETIKVEIVEEVQESEIIVDAEIEQWEETSSKYELINLKDAEIIETLDKNIFVNCLVPNLNKNCRKELNDIEVKESSSLQLFQVQKIVKLSLKEYNYFINNLLHDYNFLTQTGGWEQDDNEKLLHYYGVAIVCDNMETLIIDASGSSFARYACQLCEDLNNSLQDELSTLNTALIISNDLYIEAKNSIIDVELYEISVNNKTVINDNRYIKNISANGLTLCTGLTIKELINEGVGIDILNLQPLRFKLELFKEGLEKHDERKVFSLFPSQEDKEIENIKFMDRLNCEMLRATAV